MRCSPNGPVGTILLMKSASLQIARLLMSMCVAASVFAADPADRMVGTWKYSPEKSKVPDETIASGQWVVEKLGPNTTRTTADLTLKSGEKTHTVTTDVCDGQEHHADGRPPGAMATCDPSTHSFTSKTDGKLRMVVDTSFSSDGRAVTYHRKVLNKDDKWVEDIRVWEKQ